MVELRLATPEDAPALGEMHVAAWHETYKGILPDGMLASLSTESRAATWLQLLRDPVAHSEVEIFLAHAVGGIAGFGACGRQRDKALEQAGFTGEISALYVLRAHQRLGLGTALMSLMAGALQQSGHQAAGLWVLRENETARAFYTRLGGVIVGEREERRPDAKLMEFAYGWKELSRLIPSAGLRDCRRP
ncbi:MAG: GNAT family N-acetyltransferase [Rhodospirillales bacterium]|nr:GNAT family N-acetyltransferase [Rhodospirillales bacterium]